MSNEISKAILENLDVIDEIGELEINKLSKYLELTIDVRERYDGV